MADKNSLEDRVTVLELQISQLVPIVGKLDKLILQNSGFCPVEVKLDKVGEILREDEL